MSKPSRPATPDQVRLLIGLSSLMVLPLLAVVMIYFTVHQTVAEGGRDAALSVTNALLRDV